MAGTRTAKNGNERTLSNLRPTVTRATQQGVEGVRIAEKGSGGQGKLTVHFPDGSKDTHDFASFSVLMDWIQARKSWRGVPLQVSFLDNKGTFNESVGDKAAMAKFRKIHNRLFKTRKSKMGSKRRM